MIPVDPTPEYPLVVLGARRWHRVRSWSVRLAEFALLQVVVQVLNAMCGLVIVRSLPKSDYALYSIVNSMQSTCNILADVGVSIGVRSIGGKIWRDPGRFSNLLATVISLRRQFVVISFIVCLPIAAWLLLKNGAGIPTAAGLCVVIALSVLPALAVSAWLVAAQFHAEYRLIQQIDLKAAVLRLSLTGFLALTRIDALLAAAAAAVGNWYHALRYRRWVRGIHPEGRADPRDKAEILRLVSKALPNTIFFCLQGQITIFILTIAGHPSDVADLTALGRISALLSTFTAMFVNVLGPRFSACQDARRLPRLFLALVGGSCGVLLMAFIAVCLVPGPFLWLIGSKYSGLQAELPWVIATGSTTTLGGVLWNLTSGKAWIRFQSTFYIPAVIGAQLLSLHFLDLHQFRDVLIFNFVSSLAPMPLYLLDAYRGLSCRKEPN